MGCFVEWREVRKARYTQERLANKALMFRTITSIVLFVVLVGGNAATAGWFCAPALDHKSGRSVATHCKKAPTKTTTPMSCCRHVPVTNPEEITKASADCCQMSAPLPDQPRPALPGNASEEFRFQTQAQLLNSSEPVSLSALTSLPPGWVASTIAFCPDRSDTYLLTSTFRI